MSTSTLTRDEEQQQHAAAPALVTAQAAKPRAGDACPHCGSLETWGVSSWCPACGYYPALGGQAKAGCSQIFQAAETEEKIRLQQFFPAWALVLVGGVVAVVLLSFAAGAFLPEQGIERVLWTFSQCVLGVVVAAVGQVSAFLYAAQKDDHYGPLDAVMKPLQVWKASTTALPAGAWRFWMAAWGGAMAICAVAVVGGISYGALFEGSEKKADVNLVHEIVKQARKEREGGADSLEGAMNDFVGDEAVDPEQVEDPLAKLPTMDCLIFGFVETDSGDLDSILIASAFGTQMNYVGRVAADNIPKESRGKLFARMKELTRKKPFVQTNQEARWLQPVLMARVAYTELTRDNQMMKAYLRVMLEDVKPEPTAASGKHEIRMIKEGPKH